MATAQSNSLIPAIAIHIHRVEGQESEITLMAAAKGPCVWKQANDKLCEWARTAPLTERGYHKVDFSIFYDNGQQFSSRYALTDGTAHNLAEHIKNELHFYAGKLCPSYLKEEDYRQYLQGHELLHQGHQARCNAFLDTYQIG